MTVPRCASRVEHHGLDYFAHNLGRFRFTVAAERLVKARNGGKIAFSRAGVHIVTGGHAGWFGIDAGDWLTAITNMMAIIIAVLIAAKIAPKAEERRARRDQQERLLRVLIATSPMPANPEYQGAIALIPIDFKDNRAIIEARTAYLESVNTAPPTDEAALHKHYISQNDKQAQMIAVIAQELGFDLTSEALRSGAYVSKGFVDREQLQLDAMGAWPRIAEALERNNQMFAWSLSHGGQSPPPMDEGDENANVTRDRD